MKKLSLYFVLIFFFQMLLQSTIVSKGQAIEGIFHSTYGNWNLKTHGVNQGMS